MINLVSWMESLHLGVVVGQTLVQGVQGYIADRMDPHIIITGKVDPDLILMIYLANREETEEQDKEILGVLIFSTI